MYKMREQILLVSRAENAIYDCTKFIDIRNRMLRLTGELRACEDSSSEWFLTLEHELARLREYLEKWTVETSALSIDCQNLAREYKDNL